MARVAWGVVIGILGAAGPVHGSVSLERVDELSTRGLTQKAQAVADSLLARGGLDPAARRQVEWQRARLEMDATHYMEYLQRMLGSEDPADRSRARLGLGHLEFASGALQEALVHFRHAREEGRHEEGNLWVGITAMALGDAVEARSALGEAVRSGNSTIRQRAGVALGDVYRAGYNYARAARAYRDVRQDPRPGAGWVPVATLREAECREAMGEEDAARDLLLQLLAEHPGSTEAPLARQRLDRILAEAGVRRTADPPEVLEETVAGFALQMGAFSVEENASRLLRQLREAGAPRPRMRRGDDELYRIYVGSFPSRPGAESFGDSLGTALGLGFSVVPLGDR